MVSPAYSKQYLDAHPELDTAQNRAKLAAAMKKSPKPTATIPSSPVSARPMSFKAPKKRLTTEEEFKILTMVLDKILWLGFGIMALGLYELYKQVNNPFALMFAGAVLLVTFIVILIREYEVVRH